ncbi:response regulator [Paenibacillus elgii]|uniref:response regulator n=1 Tax=Paenibacillus elgii TaxID=189691 RepID=UPI0013D8C70D|nr:response regulator [Paenibacillus elgii]
MKVMIVEDEVLVRLGLKKAVPWSTLGMELVCEAADGAEAYEMFVRHLPDIVLVDIELPKMDGLSFIHYAKTRRPDAKFIILTCQQDMSYARSAIQLQVADFLLKSTLDMKELCDILQNLSLELRQKRREAEATGEEDMNRSGRRRRFFQSWLDGVLPAPDPDRFDAQLHEFSPALKAERYQAWVVQLHGTSLTEEETESVGEEIERLAVRQFGSRYLGGTPELPKRRWHLIFTGSVPASDAVRWKEAVGQASGLELAVAMSTPFADPYEWRTFDRQAADLLQAEFYGRGGEVYAKDDLISETMSEAVLKLKRDMYERAGSLQFEEMKRLVGDLCGALKQPPYLHPPIVKNMFTELLFRLWSACEEIASGSVSANHRLVDRFYAAVRLDELAELLLTELARAGEEVRSHSHDDKTKTILQIKQYIKTHLHRELSLQETADAFYMNSSYLSRLFREVTDQSFTEYVLREKTELAVALMKNGMHLTQISEKLGYQNLSSFTRMFKKVRGVSPSRYMDRT